MHWIDLASEHGVLVLLVVIPFIWWDVHSLKKKVYNGLSENVARIDERVKTLFNDREGNR